MLAAKLGVLTLATGDVLRAATRAGTPLGLEAKGFMDRGELVPDKVILGIVAEELTKPQYARGAILDGVVRTVPQAEGLRSMLASLGRAVDSVVVFDVDNDEIVRRLGGRTVCENCQTPYTGREAGSVCTNCGGRLIRRKDDRRLEIATRRRDARSIEVSVTDSGAGVKASELSRLFDSFYTTKPQGMGLGLSIARAIVQTHGGNIWAHSNGARGAAFTFTIPMAA